MNAKAFAILAVSVMLMASCTAVMVTDDGRNEPEGFPPIIIAVIVSGTVGGIGGWFVHDMMESDDTQSEQYLRLVAADKMTDLMSVASVFTSNSMSNYAQIWTMTKEHWIRQAELEAYAQWGHGAVYNANSVLMGSHVYENNSVMTANALAQIDSFLGQISDKVSSWGSKGTYAGKMSAGLVLDNTRLMSFSDLRGCFVSVAQGHGKVYIDNMPEGYVVSCDGYTPSYLCNPGQRMTLTNTDTGRTYVVEHGKTFISDIYSVEGHRPMDSGVYEIDGTLAGDTLSRVTGDGLPLKAGLVAESGDVLKIAVLDGERISFDGSGYNGISFKVEASDIPDGEHNPDAVDLKPILQAYQGLLDKQYWTTVSANNSARAVWDIYDRVDERDYAVTTLMASNNYDSVVLSDAMNEVMTLSAMQQLASYYDIHEDDLTDLQIGLYSQGMDSPFVRGSIVDRFGNTVYTDVIFTPFFQSEDVVLERGTDFPIHQNTFVAVWHEGMELNQWYNSGMDASDYDTVFLEEGYSLHIVQLATCDDEGMHNQSSIEFKVTKVRYIDPGKAKLTDDIDFQRMAKNILQIVCLIAGMLLLIVGSMRTEPFGIVLGIVLVVFAAVFADPVWAWITGLRLW